LDAEGDVMNPARAEHRKPRPRLFDNLNFLARPTAIHRKANDLFTGLICGASRFVPIKDFGQDWREIGQRWCGKAHAIKAANGEGFRDARAEPDLTFKRSALVIDQCQTLSFRVFKAQNITPGERRNRLMFDAQLIETCRPIVQSGATIDTK